MKDKDNTEDITEKDNAKEENVKNENAKEEFRKEFKELATQKSKTLLKATNTKINELRGNLMTNIEPQIVIKNVQSIRTRQYGEAGRIAVIGAFPTGAVNIAVYTDINTAKNVLKGDYKLPGDVDPEHASMQEVPESYTSFHCLDYLFGTNENSNGAESVTVVNINYNQTKEHFLTSIDEAHLQAALNILADEDFDILTIADNYPLAIDGGELNPVWLDLKNFVNIMYAKQKPLGVITGVLIDTNAVENSCKKFKTLWADYGMYKAVCTPIRLKGEATSLNIAQTGCWHSAYTAGRLAGKSETGKIYEGIEGEDSKTLFPITGNVTWKMLLDNGFLTQKYRNRRLGTIQCLNNVTPADYDMKIERVKNFMIRKLTFEDYIGEDNTILTRDDIKSMISYERTVAINNKLLLDLVYTVKAVSSKKVKAYIKFVIADIIDDIEVDVALEISNEVDKEVL